MSDERARRRREERKIEEDWQIDPEWLAYVTHVRAELIPKMQDSAMTVSLMPQDPQNTDVKYAIETGLSILMDKPIILCVPRGAIIPAKLRRVADYIIVGDPTRDPEVKEQLMAAIQAVGEMLDAADG